MTKIIHVSKLSPSCVTRRRGQEAALRLLKRPMTDHIQIDLTNVELVSMSFLDGLVSTIVASDALDKVTFQIPDRQLQDKLARVSAIRSINLYYCYRDGMVHQVIPKRFITPQATFVASKAPA